MTDLYTLCVQTGSLMISLESMEKRLQNPKSYYLFYKFFYRAALGESLWKQHMCEDSGTRIGNNNTQAFALLLMKNNYRAWLHEEHMKHEGNLVTEYEVNEEDTRVSIVDKWCNNDIEFAEID